MTEEAEERQVAESVLSFKISVPAVTAKLSNKSDSDIVSEVFLYVFCVFLMCLFTKAIDNFCATRKTLLSNRELVLNLIGFLDSYEGLTFRYRKHRNKIFCGVAYVSNS